MAQPAVYLETGVIGYATSRPSRDLVVAARQQITREWFSLGAPACEIFVSQLVASEAGGGDEEAVRERSAFLQGIPRLRITDAAGELAARFVEGKAVPGRAGEGALLLAVAAVHGVDYLLTWNCKHIANATMREAIEGACRRAWCERPVTWTPEELMDEEQGR